MNPGSTTRSPTVPASLREAVGDQRPLRGLEPYEYAIGHALFEARSDQRRHITDWLVARLAARAHAPSRVLSIGCGDGSVDVGVAAALAGHGQRVDYQGVEPHLPSGRLFLDRLGELRGVHATVAAETFDATRCEQGYDVVLAVHSLYYVDDLAATIRRAHSLLAPGGVLIVLHAPLRPLNVFVRYLAPGHRQGFSDEVVAVARSQGWEPTVTRLANRLDLSETGDADADRALLAFTVQAHLPPALHRAVRTALAEQALPGPGLVVSHPVDAIEVPA